MSTCSVRVVDESNEIMLRYLLDQPKISSWLVPGPKQLNCRGNPTIIFSGWVRSNFSCWLRTLYGSQMNGLERSIDALNWQYMTKIEQNERWEGESQLLRENKRNENVNWKRTTGNREQIHWTTERLRDNLCRLRVKDKAKW